MGYSLGVDLGVTFVAAAIASPTRVEMFTLGDRSVVTPAAVYLREDGTLVTGEAAAVRAVSSPDRVSREFKRRLGNPAPVMLAGKPFTVTALLGALLRDAVQKVVETQGESPERLVLTHPANWGPFRRALFEEVPQHAGLDNPPTVTEPEAAAAHYAASKLFSDGQTVAVYDLGGGTFDATVLRKQPGGMEILGTPEGIERLGGVDFDEAILSYIDYAADGALSALDLRDPQTSIAMARLRQDCVLAKETLSVDTETVIPVFLPGRHFDVRITRAEFEDMVRAQIEPTIEVLSRTLRSAGVEPGELSAVLLVGGSSRIPLVARMVSAALGRPTVVDIHPKYAVALGAAIIADAAAATSMPRLGARVAPSAKEFAGVVPAQRITRGGEAVILGGRAQQTSANMAPDSTVDPSQPAPPATGRGADRQLAPPPTTTTDTSRGWFRRNINRFHRGEDKSGPAAVSPIIPPGPPYPDAVTGFGPEEHRPVVTRYTDISAPRRLAPGRRGVITVRLTCAPLTASAEIQAVPVLLTQMVEIYLQASGKDFEVEGEPIRQLRVESDRDSESVVFYLTALRAGDAIACLDIRQAGQTVATVKIPIEISAELGSEDHAQIETPLTIGDAYAPPADVDLRVTVTVRDGRSILSYVLHSPNGTAGYHYYPAGEVTILGSPEQYQKHLMKHIEGLTGSQAHTGLRAIGEQLYRELFPLELRRAYRDLCSLPVRSLQITSDEPWIPWELVRPYDDDDPDRIVDDDFLCARFELTRWLAGRSGPASTIQIRRVACVDAGHPPALPALPSVDRERAYVTGLADRHGLEDHSPPRATSHAVSALLDGQHGQIDLWHFASHGDVSLIVLADGSSFRPEDLFGPRQTAIGRARPLVFFNACRVGQPTWSLTQLGGWAAAWAGRCHCGVFVGPLWSVTDDSAWIFARTFYDQLTAGRTLGQAMLAARVRTREYACEDPTWLAYSVYAHPNARVVFINSERIPAGAAFSPA